MLHVPKDSEHHTCQHATLCNNARVFQAKTKFACALRHLLKVQGHVAVRFLNNGRRSRCCGTPAAAAPAPGFGTSQLPLAPCHVPAPTLRGPAKPCQGFGRMNRPEVMGCHECAGAYFCAFLPSCFRVAKDPCSNKYRLQSSCKCFKMQLMTSSSERAKSWYLATTSLRYLANSDSM